MFSKSTDSFSSNEIWKCVKSFSVGYVRTRSEADAAWEELYKDERLTAQPEDDPEFFLSSNEIELHKSMLVSFMKEL